MEENFEPLQSGEVASLGKDWKDREDMFNLPLVFIANQAHTNIATKLTYLWKDYRETKQKLFGEGLEGQVLRFGADGWQKGKVRFRVTVEFCPEEAEEAEEEETEKTQETEQSETSEETATNQIEFNNFDSLDDLRREFNQES